MAGIRRAKGWGIGRLAAFPGARGDRDGRARARAHGRQCGRPRKHIHLVRQTTRAVSRRELSEDLNRGDVPMSACADRPGEKQAAGHAEAGSKIQWVPVGLLLAGDSPRLKGENAQHIRMLANSEVSLPAILVHRETMRVVDGMHRLRATLMKGQETIEVQFFEGSEDEAFIRAIAANTEHGLPL